MRSLSMSHARSAVLFIRHVIAEQREKWRGREEDRPLTE